MGNAISSANSIPPIFCLERSVKRLAITSYDLLTIILETIDILMLNLRIFSIAQHL